MSKRKKIVIAVIAIAAAAAVLAFVFRDRVNITTYKDSKEEGSRVYTIGIIQSRSGTYADQMVQGSMDAVTDIFGSTHIKFSEKRVKTRDEAKKAAKQMVKQNKDLILTCGTRALMGAEDATNETPILSVGVVNFQRALGMTVSDNWDYRTGRNVAAHRGNPRFENCRAGPRSQRTGQRLPVQQNEGDARRSRRRFENLRSVPDQQ